MATKGGKFQNSKGLSRRQREILLDDLVKKHMPGRLRRYILKAESDHTLAFLSYTGLVHKGKSPIHTPTWLQLLGACRKERDRRLMPIAAGLWVIFIFIHIYY